MNLELKMLAWTVVLGVVQIVMGVSLATKARGLLWNTGARDAVMEPLTGVAARVDRALRNLLETFPLFAAATIAVVVTHRDNASTALGAQLYFWARLVYVGLYAGGVPFVRTVVWGVSMTGLFMVLWPLL